MSKTRDGVLYCEHCDTYYIISCGCSKQSLSRCAQLTGRLTDTDPMPWGKYEGKPMQDVPASYMFWLWTEKGFENELRNHWNPVAQYIRDNLEAFKQEHPDGIWEK